MSTNSVRRRLIFFVWMAVLLFSGGPAYADGVQGAPADGTLDLDSLISEALEASPGIAAAAAGREAAQTRISQAGSLPDPMVSIAYQNDGWDRFTFGDRPMSNLSFTVSQKFPFPGKRELRRDGARGMVEASTSKLRMARAGTVKAVRDRYMDLVRTGEMLKVLHFVLREVERVEEIATARYGAGVAGMQDVLMAQAQKYRVLEKIRSLEDERRQGAAGLWEVLGRAEHAEPGTAPPVSLILPGATPETVVEIALGASPEVEMGAAQVDVAEAGLALAKRERYPDLTLTGMYAARNSSNIHDLWRVGVGTTIPLFFKDKQGAAIREAEYRLAEARQELEKARQSVRAAVVSAWSIVERSEELMRLYDGGLKRKSLEGLESSLTAYRNGKADMTMVIRNLVDSMEAEIGYWKHFAARQMAVARLAALTGFEGSGGVGNE